jgi:lycopene beta-cyclase
VAANSRLIMSKHYDYIILGTGCAGFSLAYRMSQNKFFAHKKILLLDQNIKVTNDRTWCFWESGDGLFEKIVHHKWQTCKYTDGNFETTQNVAPYQYKMIRSAKLYKYCTEAIKAHTNFEWQYGVVNEVNETTDHVEVKINEFVFTCNHLFTSVLLQEPTIQEKDIYLLQHFKGWFIHTHQPHFNPEQATIMDFSISQKHGSAFCYTLPLSPNDALVEYTLFTATELEPNEYDEALKDYLAQQCITDYQIAEQEFGIIPMTSALLSTNTARSTYIGTAGGATKPSTGYTFMYIQKQCDKIIEQLVAAKKINSQVHANRFRLYDTTLLQLLDSGALGGKEIFTRLYQKNTMPQLFKFLDNDTSFNEELKLMSTTQIASFGKAFLKARKIVK